MYYVTLTGKGSDDEFVLLKTEDEAAAVKRAKDEIYYIERDRRKGDKVEVRIYKEDIEDDDCTCFDYDLVDLRTTTEAQRRAGAKYDKAHTKQIALKLNRETDADILAKLAEIGNVQGYIKQLIREDMKN